jgi:hypothetical protein
MAFTHQQFVSLPFSAPVLEQLVSPPLAQKVRPMPVASIGDQSQHSGVTPTCRVKLVTIAYVQRSAASTQ